MSEQANEVATVEPCEHYWAWVSPAGSRRSARLCMLCHQPDPIWLNHTIEVSIGCESVCVHCEFAEMPHPNPPTPEASAGVGEGVDRG